MDYDCGSNSEGKEVAIFGYEMCELTSLTAKKAIEKQSTSNSRPNHTARSSYVLYAEHPAPTTPLTGLMVTTLGAVI